MFLIAGDAFFDTAELEPARVDQANRNAKTLAGFSSARAHRRLARPQRSRSAAGSARGAWSGIRFSLGWRWRATPTCSRPKRVLCAWRWLVYVLARSGTRSPPRCGASEETDLTIALVDGSRRDANRIGAIDGVDFVLQGGLDEDEPIPPHQAGKAWVLHASRQGQGLTVVDVFRKKKDAPFIDRSEWSRSERAGQLDRQIEDLSAKIAAWEKSGDVDAADLDTQRARLAELKTERQALDAPAVQADGNACSPVGFRSRRRRRETGMSRS